MKNGCMPAETMLIQSGFSINIRSVSHKHICAGHTVVFSTKMHQCSACKRGISVVKQIKSLMHDGLILFNEFFQCSGIIDENGEKCLVVKLQSPVNKCLYTSLKLRATG